MNSEQINRKLYESRSVSEYESTNSYNTHLLEQYKVYLASAEKISDRRQTANSFFVTLNTVLVSLISYLNPSTSNSSQMYWIVSLAGIAICFMWYRLVRSYKDLNSAKFKVIHEIEKNLPISPYDAEWEAVGRGENSKLYLPFTHIEILVPWVFLILHLWVLVSGLYSNLLAWFV
jgi:hypothetical protein